MAAIQRALCNSTYDHVSLIVKTDDCVYIFEAAEGRGVDMMDWETFKNEKRYRSYQRIAYRKLNIPDPHLKYAFQLALAEFVAENVGKKYDLSLRKLFKLRSNTNNTSVVTLNTSNIIPSNNDSLTKSEIHVEEIRKTEHKGFFCSELIAAAYKLVGLLDQKKAASRYLPVSFSQKKRLNLKRGATLSNEYGIILSND